jgi:hypothetical protein
MATSASTIEQILSRLGEESEVSAPKPKKPRTP